MDLEMDKLEIVGTCQEQSASEQTKEQFEAEITNNAMKLNQGEQILTLVHFTSTINADGNYILNAVFVDDEKKQYEYAQLQSPEWHKKTIEDFAQDKKFICTTSPRVNLLNFRPTAKKKVTQTEITPNMN